MRLPVYLLALKPISSRTTGRQQRRINSNTSARDSRGNTMVSVMIALLVSSYCLIVLSQSQIKLRLQTLGQTRQQIAQEYLGDLATLLAMARTHHVPTRASAKSACRHHHCPAHLFVQALKQGWQSRLKQYFESPKTTSKQINAHQVQLRLSWLDFGSHTTQTCDRQRMRSESTPGRIHCLRVNAHVAQP